MEQSKSTIDVGNEFEKYSLLKKAMNGGLLFGCTQSHQEANFKNFTVSCKTEADSYCYMNNKHVLEIKYIGKKNEEMVRSTEMVRSHPSIIFPPQIIFN